jgi:hypothetical protein
MKENLIIETQRIKELMGLKLISEIKLPGLDNIIKPLGILTFKGLKAGEFEAAFPTVVKKTGEAIASFLKNTDELTGPQVKVLLKLKNEALRSNIIQSISEDPVTLKAVKILMAAEERNQQGGIDLAKNALLEFLPIEELDNVINKVKDKLGSNPKPRNVNLDPLTKEAEDIFSIYLKNIDLTSDQIKSLNRTADQIISRNIGELSDVEFNRLANSLQSAGISMKKVIADFEEAAKNKAELGRIVRDTRYVKLKNAIEGFNKLSNILFDAVKQNKPLMSILKIIKKIIIYGLIILTVYKILEKAAKSAWNSITNYICNINILGVSLCSQSGTETKTGGETKTGEKTTPIPPEPAGPCPAGKKAKMRGGDIICI